MDGYGVPGPILDTLNPVNPMTVLSGLSYHGPLSLLGKLGPREVERLASGHIGSGRLAPASVLFTTVTPALSCGCDEKHPAGAWGAGPAAPGSGSSRALAIVTARAHIQDGRRKGAGQHVAPVASGHQRQLSVDSTPRPSRPRGHRKRPRPSGGRSPPARPSWKRRLPPTGLRWAKAAPPWWPPRRGVTEAAGAPPTEKGPTDRCCLQTCGQPCHTATPSSAQG